ncbi:NAD(P)H-dependent oxidoreductase [Methylobacterium oxalidis]|uniref:NAD(P)H-dependent oxidoreductase n=1 Tax=Methylobacterium oxalidis TaxID=944322 RepID=UPI003314FE0E
MTRRILILQGHPDPAGGRLCHALADAYLTGARSAGNQAELVDIAKLSFPLLESDRDWERGSMPASLGRAAEAIRSADHLVLIFPLWLGGMPALVKGFLEQVMRPGFAFERLDSMGLPRKLLGGRSARVVVTMGMPALAYRVIFLAHGIRALDRGILRFVGIRPVRTTFLGMVGAAGEGTRKRWLERMVELGRRGA